MGIILQQANRLQRFSRHRRTRCFVSVRQCLYYLLSMTNGASTKYKAKNKTPLEDWITQFSDEAPANQPPMTPFGGVLSTEDAIRRLTPDPSRIVSNPSDPIVLCRFPSQSLYTAILQFQREQIQMGRKNNLFVKIQGQEITAEIVRSNDGGEKGEDKSLNPEMMYRKVHREASPAPDSFLKIGPRSKQNVQKKPPPVV